MEVLIVVATIVARLTVGSELAIAVFVHPTLDTLPDDVHLPAASALARVQGTFMPFWYVIVSLLTLAEGCNPMAPIWLLTDLDRYISRFVDVGNFVFAHRPRADQQPYQVQPDSRLGDSPA